jgi:hypothetical protein
LNLLSEKSLMLRLAGEKRNGIGEGEEKVVRIEKCSCLMESTFHH